MTLTATLKNIARPIVRPFRARRSAPAARPWPEILSFESSYKCNLVCPMCPRSFDEAKQGHFAGELFDRLEEDLGNFRYVHMTGWGEPLMNPALPDWLARASAKGAWANFTTNGLLLRGKLLESVLASNVGAINVSIDGATEATYARARGKNAFEALLKTLENLRDRLREADKPVYLQWVFVLMRYNFEEFPAAVELGHRLGFDNVVGKHLEAHSSKDGLEDALFPTEPGQPWDEELEARYQAMLAKAAEAGTRLGQKWSVHARNMRAGKGCLSAPTNTIYIDYQGNVSACCHLSGMDTHPYKGEDGADRYHADSGILGNLREAPLRDIVAGPAYRGFVEAWEQDRVPKACEGCLQIARMNLDRE
jgi:MoaA/NifB/PqqE/SkfB family radical SAM enzyme